ncbi:MAG: DUF1566 domain-containing protein [Sulfuricaulis sp.]|nr:DUF1566 domain-containing protein [Sulfuricaulis sp.]
MKQTSKLSAVALIVWACVQLFWVNAHAACDASVKRSTPNTDFEFLARGAAVRHNKTGLVWQRCPEGMTFITGAAADHSRDTCGGMVSTFTLEGAKQLQAKVNAGAGREGATDWRIPAMEELVSIVEEACQVPAINTAVFPNTPVTWFWAASPKALPAGSGQAWGIGFGAGGYYTGRNDHGAVRLVHGAR